MHMLRRNDPHFIEFGEIYFSTVYAGVVKGWHQQEDMNAVLRRACTVASKLVAYDDRARFADARGDQRVLPRPRRLRRW